MTEVYEIIIRWAIGGSPTAFVGFPWSRLSAAALRSVPLSAAGLTGAFALNLLDLNGCMVKLKIIVKYFGHFSQNCF